MISLDAAFNTENTRAGQNSDSNTFTTKNVGSESLIISYQLS